jgi:hypothetical protein
VGKALKNLPDTDYRADILVNFIVGIIEILIDGEPVLNWMSPVYPHPESEVYIGRNPFAIVSGGQDLIACNEFVRLSGISNQQWRDADEQTLGRRTGCRAAPIFATQGYLLVG